MSFLKPFITVLNHPNNKGRSFKALAMTGWWKVNQLFFHLPAVVEIAPGVKIVCYPENSYGSFVVYAKWPEYAELHFIYQILKANDTYIDVGAHIGDSSLLAASKVKTGKVLACEPTPAIFQELVTNIRLNHFEKTIVPIQKAISDQVGTVFFTLENESEINHIKHTKGKGKNIKIPATTIDALVKEQSLKKVSLLKIDVEGFELEVLQGARKSLKLNKIAMVLFEVNPSVTDIPNKLRLIEDLLDSFSFVYYSFDEKGFLELEPELFVPTKTSNFLAVSKKYKKTAAFKKCLK